MAQIILKAQDHEDIDGFHRNTAIFGQAGIAWRADILHFFAQFPESIVELSGKTDAREKNALNFRPLHIGEPIASIRTPAEKAAFNPDALRQIVM